MRLCLAACIYGLVGCLGTNVSVCENGVACPSFTRCVDNQCVPDSCGNGIADGIDECDGTDFGGRSCTDLGFYGGTLSCTAQCRVDGSQCEGACGDGIVTGLEFCDGTPPPVDCTGYRFHRGATDCGTNCGTDLSQCGIIGWTRAEVPPLVLFNDVDGVAYDKLIAVGDGGAVWHHDGISWRPRTSSVEADLVAVAAVAADQAWAALRDGGLIRFDGDSWSVAEVPSQIGIRSLWGKSANEVYAVGDQGTIWRFDGATWNVEVSPYAESLSAVRGAGDVVYAVGATALLKRVAGVWAEDNVLGPFSDVLPVSENDVWVLRTAVPNSVYRFDGSNWTPVPEATNTFTTAAAVSPSQVYFFGSSSLVYDGNRFSPLDFTEAVATAWAGPEYAVVVTSLRHLLRYQRTDWVPTPLLSNRTLRHARWLSDELIVVAQDARVTAFDGNAWSEVASQEVVAFTSAWAIARDDIYAVAGSEIRHFDGNGWTVVYTASANLLDVNARAGTVLAAGADGLVVVGTSAGYNAVPTGKTDDLVAVAGLGADDIWVAGNYFIGHFDGSAWAFVELDNPNNSGKNTDIWRADQGAWIAAPPDRIYFWDGLSDPVEHATNSSEVTGPTLGQIDGAADDDIFAALHDSLFHYDGRTWSAVETSMGLRAVGLAVTPKYVTVVETSEVGSFIPVTNLTRGTSWPCKTTERCGDGVDNDCDGLTDLFDDECSGN